MTSDSCTACPKGPMKFCPFSLFLFASSAIAFTQLALYRSSKKTDDAKDSTEEKNSTTTLQKPFQVVFVLGGPGAGKGTQCSLLSEKLGWSHLSAGDLLRAERKSGSELAELINLNIQAGKIVPASITVGLLQKAMEEARAKDGTSKFLIDGFPRSEGNVSVWKDKMSSVSNVEFVLFLDCPEDVMTGRLLERGEGRSDDNLETIRKRFRTFHEESMPIVKMYEKEGKVRNVKADRSVDDVYKEVEALFKDLQ